MSLILYFPLRKQFSSNPGWEDSLKLFGALAISCSIFVWGVVQVWRAMMQDDAASNSVASRFVGPTPTLALTTPSQAPPLSSPLVSCGPSGGAKSPFAVARACYQLNGCEATAALCRTFGGGGASPACATLAARQIHPTTDVLQIADSAVDAKCPVDALAWLAGATGEARVLAIDRAANLVAKSCEGGGFGANTAAARTIAQPMNAAIRCLASSGNQKGG
jgi:hypothetical protein